MPETYDGAVVPSIITPPVMVGSDDANVIVPLTLNLIVSTPARALASKIACLNEPAPLSFVLVTIIMEEFETGLTVIVPEAFTLPQPPVRNNVIKCS